MRAKLKSIHSPDVDLNTYWPEKSDNFGFLVQAMIGPEGQDGEESFGIEICTPDWLKSQYRESEILFGRHLMIVFEYDKNRIESYIAEYCERCVGDTWQDIASQLSRIGHWEFEDYISA